MLCCKTLYMFGLGQRHGTYSDARNKIHLKPKSPLSQRPELEFAAAFQKGVVAKSMDRVERGQETTV